ncbi:uncharacterized protein LOC126298576 [Schistocerca gregaria]|uniref:uncharacterized protein LOC126298576 n=1 Tax=Schistocerca gregaria TaxID=7010 RepID=UPI00211EF0AB|nr:uncharacterized protein LOC126298576 [Schistocerca gregaria]
MSSRAANAVGLNAIMCYFPWFPYYHRYQIGFDIIVNQPDAQADPSVAGQSQRLIHVRLYFPDGFLCNPANFARMPHPSSSEGGAPHFYPPHPHSHPPMYPNATPPFHHRVPMGFQGPMMWQEQVDARVIVYVVNGQPGEFMVIDDTPYEVIPKCKDCNEFHSEPEHIHRKRSQGDPEHKPSQHQHPQFGPPHQHPSTSGATGRKGTGATPCTASESVATDPKNQDNPKVTQQMAGEPQPGPLEGVQGIQHKNDTVTLDCSHATVATVTKDMDRLDISTENNDGNLVQGKGKLSADPDTDESD